jgi:hypothetical protein
MNESGMTEPGMRERGAARPGAAETEEASIPQHSRVRNLSRWIDRDRQLHYSGPLAPQDRYPGRIATP